MTDKELLQQAYGAFYTMPPKKEWVGLTDEEIEDEVARILTTLTRDIWPVALSKAIEELLRRKNT